MFVPDEIWVTANFKETQLDAMRPGQPVTLRIDAYPDRTSTAMSPACSPDPAPPSRCCRRRTPPATTSRSSSACRSRSCIDDPPADVALGPGMSVVPTVRVDPPPSLYERLGRGCERGTAASGAPAATRAAANPWLIAVLVALAAFMEVLDTTIANVALPYIAGGMGVSEDEASWVVTTYLVANAVILTASTFLAKRLGRKTFFLVCLALFTVSSVLCGFAWSLQSLLVFRLLQGLGGGGMVPVAQSILARFVPAAKARPGLRPVRRRGGGGAGGRADARRLARRQYLLALVLPDQRPGRRARDRADCDAPARAEGRRRGAPAIREQAGGFDLVGFLLVATFLGALEIVLDRGLEDDWFGSTFIIAVAAVCALAFVLMIPWEISHRFPTIDVRMLATRQFGACFLVMLATGAILFGDHAVPAATGAAGFRLHRHLGGARAVAGRHRHHADDVRGGTPVGQCAAEIPDRRRRDPHRAVDVRADQGLWRRRLLVLRHVAHRARGRAAADLPADHGGVLRRHSAGQDRPGLGA